MIYILIQNLATAFVFRFAVLALWTIASSSNLFRDCTHFVPIHRRNLVFSCAVLHKIVRIN